MSGRFLRCVAPLAALAGLVAGCGADYALVEQPPDLVSTDSPRCGGPGGLACGTHGRCEDAKDGMRCACDLGYEGAGCAACSKDYQDNDGDGTCLPACTVKCGAHERCSDASAAATCNCAPGYVKQAGGCVFRGGPLDPTFENKPKAWSVTKGVLDPGAKTGPNGALVDPGLVRFETKDVCDGTARLTQSFEMPTVAEAEPLAVRWVGSGTFVQALASSRGVPLMDMGLGFVGTRDAKRCVGERWLGRTIDLSIDFLGQLCPSTDSTSVLDHVELLPDPTCPAVGELPNGNFDGTGGWVAEPFSGVAEVANGVGTGQTRGGRLASTKFCQSPQIRNLASPRETSAQKLALKFTYKGGTNQRMEVTTSRGPLGFARGTNVFETGIFCVPDAIKGEVIDLYMRLAYRSPVAPSNCDSADVREFVFDDLALAPDGKCADSVRLADGGFEDTSNAQAWIPSEVSGQSYVGRGSGHSGKSGAVLSVYQTCATAQISTMIAVPPPPATAGPAVKFWIKGTLSATGSFGTTYGSNVPVPTAWEQRTHCVPPRDANRARTFYFTLYGGSGACGQAGTSSVTVDDVEVTTDPSCPTK